MEKIYLIEDCDGLKYVGRTKQKLSKRFAKHKYNKKMGKYCSSTKLDLDNCDIICLDIADSPEEARELEEFYINSINCVNEIKLNYNEKEHKKEFYHKNRDEINKKQGEYYEKNKEKILARQKEYRAKKNKI